VPPRSRNANAELAAHARSIKNVARLMPAIWTVDRPCRPLPDDKLIDKREVVEIVKISYSTIWGLMVEHKFPRPLDASERSLWLRSEVLQFISMLARRRLKGDPPPPAPVDPIVARRAEQSTSPRQRRAPPARATTRRARSSERSPMTQE
jgi:predicted DNA-binding transcriptional regulator AlpA